MTDSCIRLSLDLQQTNTGSANPAGQIYLKRSSHESQQQVYPCQHHGGIEDW